MDESKDVSKAPTDAQSGLPPLSGARIPAGGRTPTAEDEAYDIRIARDGTWYYLGSPIGRIALVKLFSTVLRRDAAGDYWLITPAERGRIIVDDAPFVAVALTVEGEGQAQVLRFRTNLDHEVEAGPDRPIRVETTPGSGEPNPYILVRDRLEARINRPAFYQLVELAEARQLPPEAGGGSELGVWSKGVFFSLGRLSP